LNLGRVNLIVGWKLFLTVIADLVRFSSWFMRISYVENARTSEIVKSLPASFSGGIGYPQHLSITDMALLCEDA
jgi:hypothetical protein